MLRLIAALTLTCGIAACGSGTGQYPLPEGTGGAGGMGGCHPGQAILAGRVDNARDLGGTPLTDGSAVACGAIYRGPPLAYFNKPACDEYVGLGMRTVVDLRTDVERSDKPDSDCVTATTNVVFTPLPVPYSVSPTDYIADLNAPAMATALKLLGDDASYPIYVHCTWGRDRTGVFSAVVLSALGASREAILREYLLSQASVGAYPDSLVAVLDELDRQGGIEAYLSDQGISTEQLATLRAHGLAH